MSQRRFPIRRAGTLAFIGGICLLLSGTAAHAQANCVGDCDGNSVVAINELVLCVNIALDARPVADCPSCACVPGMDSVPINCLIQAVNNALGTCEPPPQCPLEAGQYTITSLEGSTLRVATLSEFPFPPGGKVVQQVAQGNAQCVHEVVVGFPGGFSAPVFCIPGLGFTVEVAQTSCGVGRIDSDGGGDFTVAEVGDTSDSSDVCNLPQECINGQDSSVRVDVTVGDGTTDTCTSGMGNAIVAIPVHTVTWLENANPGQCPAEDGTYNPENGDMLISEFDQILDFTTDATATQWQDLDGNDCSIAGVGPPGGFPSRSGVCLNLDDNTVTTVASGPVGSIGGPLFDLTFLSTLPNAFSGPEEPTGQTCQDPPAINFAGTATRCLTAE
jgi:hypothetical protein